MDINHFNAESARNLVKLNNGDSEEVKTILNKIKSVAENGSNNLHVQGLLNPTILEVLNSKGFKVIKHPSLAQQKDSLYYTISW